MTYGFLSESEFALLDELMVTLKEEFGVVRFLEVGVFAAGTTRGIVNRCKEIGCPVSGAGVDFPEYRPNPMPECNYEFYEGDSMDAWRKITGTFGFLFIDGCHCVAHTVCDFSNYSPFLEVGGYCLFHDTAVHDTPEGQGKWPQDHSYAGQPPSFLGVREGLKKLGLLQGYRKDWEFVREVEGYGGLMGMVLVKKLKEL